METPLTPGLVWTDAFPETCPLTGGPVEEREALVECAGTGEPPEDVVLGYSTDAACWFAPLSLLLEIAADAGVSPLDATPFRIDEVEQRTGVMVESRTMPWDAFADAMRAIPGPGTPAPTFREVRALPVVDETWELAFEEAEGMSLDEMPGPVYVAAVADAGGEPRATKVRAGRFTVSDLAEIVRRATRHPFGLGDARPLEVRVDDPALVPKLEKLLKPAGIRVRRGDTPDAYGLLDELMGYGGSEFDLPALFADDSDAAVRAYFDAAARFFAARPWERLHGDRFLAVQDADAGPGAPWTYVSVMGQMDDQPGLSLFRTWPDVCRMTHDRRLSGTPDLEALGEAGLQGVTLYLESDLNPDDAQRLEALEIGPTAAHQLALPLRLSAAGASHLDPPLAWTTALLSGLPDILAKRRAATVTSIKKTITHGDTRLTLRYPARGDEGLAHGVGDVRLTVDGAAPNPKLETMFGFAPEILGPGSRLVVEGPPGTSAFAVARAVERAFKSAGKWGMLNAVLAGGQELWSGRAYASEPAPTLDDLLTLGDVTFLMGMAPFRASAERLAPDAVPDLRAEVVSA